MKHAIPLLVAWALLGATAAQAPQSGADAYNTEIETWRAQRVERLTSPSGWLTLVGLYWFKPGENTFGSDRSNALVLDHAALAARAGTFVLDGAGVRLIA